jgi:hypothetical protein
MTTTDPSPFLTHEWRTTNEIALDAWDAEGRRGDFHNARDRVRLALRRMEAGGRVERMDSVSPNRWRFSQ